MNGCSKKLCPMQVGTTDNCTLTKEQCPYYTQDIDVQKVLNLIKANVAREIFEEIEKCFFEELVGQTEAKLLDEEMLAELKKKYPEEGK